MRILIEDQLIHETRRYLPCLQWQIHKMSRPNPTFLSGREAYDTAHQGLVDDLTLMADIAKQLAD